MDELYEPKGTTAETGLDRAAAILLAAHLRLRREQQRQARGERAPQTPPPDQEAAGSPVDAAHDAIERAAAAGFDKQGLPLPPRRGRRRRPGA